MALRAKPPELEVNRFRALIFGAEGCGKSYFCCSIPHVYYIDTENVLKYKSYVEMLKNNKSDTIQLSTLEDIIQEVNELRRTKHDYKTLVIDSISIPYTELGFAEAIRLKDASGKENVEGTEFGANMAKPKRLLNHLSNLLMKLDMNVIVTCHEKTKFEGKEDAGKTYDVNEKIAYALGCVINLVKQGENPMAFFKKSRYKEFPDKSFISLKDGYEVLKKSFGEEIFLRESMLEKFINDDQLEELNKLVKVLNVNPEVTQKWLLSSKCSNFTELTESQAQKYIDACKQKLNTKGE